MMTVRVKFLPQGALKKGNKQEVYAIIKYQMFDELKQEFSNTKKYKEEMRYLLEPIEVEGGTAFEYDQSFEYPYGKFEIKLVTALKVKKEDQEVIYNPIPVEEEEFFIKTEMPKPISLADLRIMHNKEDAENR